MAVQGGEAGLRIEVDRQYTVAAQRHELREVGGGGRLAAAPFEIHHRDDLEGFAVAPVRDVAAGALPALVKRGADPLDIVDRVRPPAVRLRRWSLAFGDELAKVPLVDPR